MAKEAIPERPKTLAAAVCAVMAAVGTVEKTGNNKFHGYKFASEYDLLRAVQPAMADAGLALMPVGADIERVDGPETARGKRQWVTQGTMSYRLVHESGEKETLVVPCCGIDGEDKGAYKAATGALKYAIRQAFLIPTGDDPDNGNDPDKQQGSTEADLKQARKLARSWVVAQLYAKAAEGFHAPSFSKVLKEAGLPQYADVKHFCLWLGRPKPSTMDDEQREALVGYLTSGPGKKAFDVFVKECGL